MQPTLFKAADGSPLYAPFHLSQTIPAMALAHLTIAGGVEFVLTAGVITYLQRANLPVMRINHAGVADTDVDLEPTRPIGWRWALIGLGAMVLLTPLGLIAPGAAFGEDAPNELNVQNYGLSRVPTGLRHYAGFWHNALFDGYTFSDDKHPIAGYLLSAGIGIVTIGVAIVAVFGARRRRAGARHAARDRAQSRSRCPASSHRLTVLLVAHSCAINLVLTFAYQSVR